MGQFCCRASREINAGYLGIVTDKRIRIQRHKATMSTLGDMINAAIELRVQSVDVESDPELVTPVGYKDTVRSRKWRESMRAERGALDKRRCYEIVRIPPGITLIRSCNVYKLKKNWTGKVVKWKSRLMILGCNQVKGLEYGETFPPWPKQQNFYFWLHLPRC